MSVALEIDPQGVRTLVAPDGTRRTVLAEEDFEAVFAAFNAQHGLQEQPTVPEAVTARQARLALLGAGMLPMVEGALASIPGVQGEAARIEWEYALEIRRISPLIAALAPLLGLTDDQVDDLFRAAGAL